MCIVWVCRSHVYICLYKFILLMLIHDEVLSASPEDAKLCQVVACVRLVLSILFVYTKQNISQNQADYGRHNFDLN